MDKASPIQSCRHRHATPNCTIPHPPCPRGACTCSVGADTIGKQLESLIGKKLESFGVRFTRIRSRLATPSDSKLVCAWPCSIFLGGMWNVCGAIARGGGVTLTFRILGGNPHEIDISARGMENLPSIWSASWPSVRLGGCLVKLSVPPGPVTFKSNPLDMLLEFRLVLGRPKLYTMYKNRGESS